jgi:hypothetical protein
MDEITDLASLAIERGRENGSLRAVNAEYVSTFRQMGDRIEKLLSLNAQLLAVARAADKIRVLDHPEHWDELDRALAALPPGTLEEQQ